MLKKLILSIFLYVFYFSSTAQINSFSHYANKLNIKIGAALGTPFYSNYETQSNYDSIVVNNFNIIVPENEMKFMYIEPTQGNFNFTKPDIFVDYAIRHGMQVRGHTLCWHSSNPTWINNGMTNGIANGLFTRASLMAILKNHITVIMSRYKGKVQQWDVLNEAFNDNGTLRTNIWQQVIGNDYIDSVFVWANRVDPTAKLFYNDYYIESSGFTKAGAVFNYLKAMKSRKIPITGVGFQCHFTVGKTNFSLVDKLIKSYASIGLEVAITELDVMIKNTDYVTNSALQLSNQAKDYSNSIKLCIDNPNCKTFVTWGFTDLYSWIPSYSSNAYDNALYFDTSYLPKPSYSSVLTRLYNQSLLQTEIVNTQYNSQLTIENRDNKFLIKSEKTIENIRIIDLIGNVRATYNVQNSNFEIPLTDYLFSLIILRIQFADGLIVSKKILLSTK